MDLAISLLTPIVLDLLFGNGQKKIRKNFSQFSKNIEMYGYGYDEGQGLYGTGLFGTGYRYPKVRRQVTVESLYGSPDYMEKWARAALMNKALAKQNPWIAHLKATGAFDQIRNVLQQARATYKPKDISKLAKTASRRAKKLNILKNYLASGNIGAVQSAYEAKKYADFAGTKQEIINRINEELAKLEALEKLALQPALPPPQ
jgi:hypothetical protein